MDIFVRGERLELSLPFASAIVIGSGVERLETSHKEKVEKEA